MPAIPETFLWALGPVVADFLHTEELFREIATVTEDMENVADQVERALAGILKGPTGKTGLAIIVHTVRGGGGIANLPAAFNQEAAVIFGVAEVPVINRNTSNGGVGLPGLVVAECIVAVMKNFKSVEIATTFWEPDKPIALPRYDPDTGLVMHIVTMHCHGGLDDNTAVVATPVITLSETHLLDITCATAGAEIYYTSGARPNKYEAGASLWTGGSVVTGDGVTVKARAYKAGMRASLIATASN